MAQATNDFDGELVESSGTNSNTESDPESVIPLIERMPRIIPAAKKWIPLPCKEPRRRVATKKKVRTVKTRAPKKKRDGWKKVVM